MTIGIVVVARLAPYRTGRAFGSAQGLTGLLALPAGLLFGLLYQNSGGSAALMASAGATGVAVLVWSAVTPPTFLEPNNNGSALPHTGP